jgi:hypothetical protein
MPSTTPERLARWGTSDSAVIKYLEDRGYVLNGDWTWTLKPWRDPTEEEIDAMIYLMEEWDFGWFREDRVDLSIWELRGWIHRLREGHIEEVIGDIESSLRANGHD